jgi:hypothetical protein
MKTPQAKLKQRPAESGGAAGSAALLLCRIFGVKDPDVLVAVGALIGVLPAAITYIVSLVRG